MTNVPYTLFVCMCSARFMLMRRWLAANENPASSFEIRMLAHNRIECTHWFQLAVYWFEIAIDRKFNLSTLPPQIPDHAKTRQFYSTNFTIVHLVWCFMNTDVGHGSTMPFGSFEHAIFIWGIYTFFFVVLVLWKSCCFFSSMLKASNHEHPQSTHAANYLFVFVY